MAFCVKCGSSIKDSWKHCPDCGQKIAQLSSKDLKEKISKIAKPLTLKNKDLTNSSDFINKNLQDLKSKTENLNGSVPSPIKIISGILLLLLIVLAIGARSSNPINSSTSQEASTEVESIPSPSYDTDRASFDSSLQAYLSAGCKPKYTTAGSENDDRFAAMELEGVSNIQNFPADYNRNPEYFADWGNVVDKALIASAAYEIKLSGLYFYIKDLYRSEMRSFSGRYTDFINQANTVANSLCYKSNPSDAQFSSAQAKLDKLMFYWSELLNWLESAEAKQQEISQQIDQEITPHCTEVKTDNPNYNIVKCSNLP